MHQEVETNQSEYLKGEVTSLWETLWNLDYEDYMWAAGLTEFDKTEAVVLFPQLTPLYLEGEPIVLLCPLDPDSSFPEHYQGYDIIVTWPLMGWGDGTQRPQKPGYEVWIYPNGQAFIEEFIAPPQFKLGWTEQCEIIQPKRAITPEDLPRIKGLIQHINIIYHAA